MIAQRADDGKPPLHGDAVELLHDDFREVRPQHRVDGWQRFDDADGRVEVAL